MATQRSLYIEYLIVVVAAAFMAIAVWTGFISPMVLLGIILFVGLDLLLRYTSLKEEPASSLGFYEWLIRLRLK